MEAKQAASDGAADSLVTAWIVSRVQGYVFAFASLFLLGKCTWSKQKKTAEETLEALNTALVAAGVSPFLINFEQGEDNENKRSEAEAESTDAAMQLLAVARKRDKFDDPEKLANKYI